MAQYGQCVSVACDKAPSIKRTSFNVASAATLLDRLGGQPADRDIH
jgi:hypothetical protein